MRVNPKNPGAEKNLRRFGKEVDPVEAGRKGGSTKSLAKTKAMRLKGWKEKFKNGNLKEKDYNWALAQANDDKVMALNMLEFLDRSKEKFTTNNDVIKFSYAMANIFKAIHGERVKMQSINVNVNAGDVLAEDILEKAFGVKKKKEDEKVIDVEVIEEDE